MAIALAHPPDASALRLSRVSTSSITRDTTWPTGRSADGPNLEGAIGPTGQASGVANYQ
jgi:hypothetical protein